MIFFEILDQVDSIAYAYFKAATHNIFILIKSQV